MNKPTTVPIMGIDFTIKHPKKVDDGHAHGLTKGDEHYIELCSSLQGDAFERVLLHETMHGILYVSGLTELLDEKTEEAIVLALEHGLSQLYSRNYS